jgi:phosphoribosylanthranilate isomerase
MTTKAKICGLSTPEAVTAAVTGGAAFVGFVFFAKSPRNLDPEAAARLAAPLLRKARSGPWPSPSIPTTPWSTG